VKSEHVESAGDIRVVLRADGGVYVGLAEERAGMGDEFVKNTVRVGSSAAICAALAEAFAKMAEYIRGQPKESK
jgi:hypothetical protein